MPAKVTTTLLPTLGKGLVGGQGSPALVRPAVGTSGGHSAPLPAGIMGRGPGISSPQAKTAPPPLDLDSSILHGLKSRFGRDAIALALEALGSKRQSVRATFAKLGLSLTYNAQNLNVYTLAYAGAMAGMLGGRSIASSNSPDYVTQAYAAGVWAQTFDTLFASSIIEASTISQIEAVLIFLESYAVWDGRSATTLTTAECAPTVGAVLANIEEVLAYFILVGIGTAPWITAGTQSGYSGPPGAPVDLVVSPGASVLAAPVPLTVVTGAEHYVLNGTVYAPPAGYADSPALTVLFYVDGANVGLTTFAAAVGGATHAIVWCKDPAAATLAHLAIVVAAPAVVGLALALPIAVILRKDQP